MTTETPDRDVDLGKIAVSAVLAASVSTGRSIVGGEDRFVRSQSQFDRQARVCLRESVLKVDQRVYLDYCASQVTRWTQGEIAALEQIIGWVAKRFDPWPFTLPSTVYLVKTTGQEERRAAYTRRKDTIVLPAGKLESLIMPSPDSDPLYPRRSTDPLRNLLLHEFFHVISANNPTLRQKLYGLIGYRQLANAVPLPKVAWPEAGSTALMPGLKITNPDTPEPDVAISLEVEENGERRSRSLMPVLLSDRPYQGGGFSEYFGWYLMAVEEKAGVWAAALDGGGRPLMYPMSDKSPLWPQYLTKIGGNLTNELFHPDEIMAQNFVFTALLPTSSVLSEIETLLGEGGNAGV